MLGHTHRDTETLGIQLCREASRGRRSRNGILRIAQLHLPVSDTQSLRHPKRHVWSDEIQHREMLSGKSYGLAADIWSLGCVLVTCLSGQPAFNVRPVCYGKFAAFVKLIPQASTPEAVFDNICGIRYSLPQDSSLEVCDFIDRLLQKV